MSYLVKDVCHSTVGVRDSECVNKLWTNITKVTYPDGYYVSKTYDQLNRLTDIYLNGSTTAAAVLAYDELSRRTTLTFSSGAVISYTYDTPSANELAELAHTFVGSNVTFAYNHDQTREITAIGVTDPTYMWHPQMGVSTTYSVRFPGQNGTPFRMKVAPDSGPKWHPAPVQITGDKWTPTAYRVGMQ
jgi:hypothetical protein